MAEPLTALRTHEGLLSGVDTLVLPQVAQIVEVAATVPTLVPPLDFNLLFHRPPCPADAGTGPCSCATLVLAPFAPPGVIAAVSHGGCSRAGGLQGLESLGISRVRVYQFDMFLQEHRVRAEGSTQGADIGVAGELLAWKHKPT